MSGAAGRKGWETASPTVFGKPVDRLTRSLVERNDLLSKASRRRTEIEPARGYDLVSEKFFRGKCVKQRLQRFAASDYLAAFAISLTSLVISDPHLSGLDGARRGRSNPEAESRRQASMAPGTD